MFFSVQLDVTYGATGLPQDYIEVGINTLKSSFTYLKPCFLEQYPFFGENGPIKMAEQSTHLNKTICTK